MGLSRLDNFLKSVKGNILYVDPNSIDSTDSIENQGNSPTRPFKTIQRALAEAARFSYQVGNRNDRFNKTTIFLQPGEHIVDNRPGLIIDDDGNYITRSGIVGDSDFVEWTLLTNFNILDDTNTLYKLNSIHGGVIIPKGTSIVGVDLRKTKIIPKYIPNPENNNIERSAIFRVTGSSFISGLSVFDADINSKAYKDYTSTSFTPNFSHHKLTVFEYADGVNDVFINDEFISNLQLSRTDLDIYYEKIALVYGESSGRSITDPVYGDTVTIDIEKNVDESQIVGFRDDQISISSISASGTTATVTLEEEVENLSVNTPIEISGVLSSNIGDIYNGQYVITSVISSTQFTYSALLTNVDTSPNVNSGVLTFIIDSVTTASPYVFNCSLRSVYGMCGLHADGSKVTGFKSMVVAQYTGIGLQKDPNAFVKYNTTAGIWQDALSVNNIQKNSESLFKPEYANYHIKASNDAFIQVVSVFAIGYATQFLAESGGDLSITNSNSNFGAKALASSGFRDEAFAKDDFGYITSIQTPKFIGDDENPVQFLSIDVGLTTSVSAGAGTTTKLYLSEQTSQSVLPIYSLGGYKIGGKINEIVYVDLAISGIISTYSSNVTMENVTFSHQKEYNIAKESNGIENDITQSNGIILLEQDHDLVSGEKVRIVSDNGRLPDPLSSEEIYYVITSEVSPGLATSEVKLAQNYDNALLNLPLTPNKKGGNLKIVSKVADKIPGDFGHPIQYDVGNSNWYLNVAETNNNIYDVILANGTANAGNNTPKTYLKRKISENKIEDSIYKFRYIIPKEGTVRSRPPTNGLILQESNTTLLNENEVDLYFDDTLELSSFGDIRNPGYISFAEWSSDAVTIHTELPHNLSVGSYVKIQNITSGINTTADFSRGYNGKYEVTSIPSNRSFTYTKTIDPGTFLNDTTIRNTNLPVYSHLKLKNTYKVQTVEELQTYIPQKQDGIYNLTIITNKYTPSSAPFTEEVFSQPIKHLYPQIDRDNPVSDPDAALCSANNRLIGLVNINDPEKSLTKETVHDSLNNFNIGIGISNIISSSGTAHTIYTTQNHKLNGISEVSITSAGSNYLGPLDYYAATLVGFGGSTVGSGANAKITIGAGGALTDIVIMDSGGNYGIGNTLQVIPAAGIGTTTGFVPAVVEVTSIVNNINDVIEIAGISDDYSQYNTSYRVVGLSTEDNKKINVSSASSISSFSTTLIDNTNFENSFATYTGKRLEVFSTTYDYQSGIGTIIFNTSHGLSNGASLLLGNYNEEFFNKTVIVNNIISLSSVSVDFLSNETPITPTGTAYGYPKGYTYNKENISRNVYSYGGVQSTLLTQLTSDLNEDDELNINNAVSSGFKKGDFLLVNNEIFRVKSGVTTNTVNVYRNVLGSPRQTHDIGSLVRKINVIPVELRRETIIRASGHTFEYVGFGPGNYSTAFPEKQDRILSYDEDRLSKSFIKNGGKINFTGMDNNGDLNLGNKKLKSSTGKEEIFEIPFLNITGEEIDVNDGYSLINTSDIIVDRSITVNGGKNSQLLSEFNSPVIFNEKVTSSSPNGFEVVTLALRGNENISRNYTLTPAIPTFSGNYGDVSFNSEPANNENVGWIYTKDNEWRSFGWINNNLFGVGVSTASGAVGFSTLLNYVGVGVSILLDYDENSGISTINISASQDNKIGIYTGDSNTSTFIGSVTNFEIASSDQGFGLNISSQYDVSAGIATIIIENPIDTFNFSNTLPRQIPTFTTRSPGTRIVYYDSLSSNSVDYAVGVGANDSLWNSIPQNNSVYKFSWYGGITEIASLSGNGNFSVIGNITGNRFVSTTTSQSPLSVASSIKSVNFNADYLDGYDASLINIPFTIPVRDGDGFIDVYSTGMVDSQGIGRSGGWFEDPENTLGYIPFNKAGDDSIGICTFYQISDVINAAAFGGGALSVSYADGPIRYITNNTVSSLNITNVPTTNNRASNYTVIMKTSGTTTLPTTFQINSSTVSVEWLNGLSPSGTVAGTYFFGFTILRVASSWVVLGVFADYN